jgi:RNA polymerase sigma-70 factor (ECF subfamily)
MKKNTETREDTLKYQMVGLLPRLRRFARSLARDPDKADDLVQAACERALGRLHQVSEGTRLDSWLYRIIYTQWIDHLRRRKTRYAKLSLLSSENTPKTLDTEPGKHIDVALDLQNALNALPEDQRAAVMLVCVEGNSYAEAAAVMEIPAGTVASRVARARTALGKFLYKKSSQIFHINNRERIEGKK